MTGLRLISLERSPNVLPDQFYRLDPFGRWYKMWIKILGNMTEYYVEKNLMSAFLWRQKKKFKIFDSLIISWKVYWIKEHLNLWFLLLSITEPSGWKENSHCKVFSIYFFLRVMRIIILYSCLDVALCSLCITYRYSIILFEYFNAIFQICNTNTLPPPLINPDACTIWEQMYPE